MASSSIGNPMLNRPLASRSRLTGMRAAQRRADIDEAAWATLYGTRSRPFRMSSSGKIAVKAINHYGDEVLKIIEM